MTMLKSWSGTVTQVDPAQDEAGRTIVRVQGGEGDPGEILTLWPAGAVTVAVGDKVTTSLSISKA